eukprot:9468345-Pyramimonas_sp.AAC.2
MVATGSLSIAAALLVLAVASTPYCDKYAWYYPWGNSSRLSNLLGLTAGGKYPAVGCTAYTIP